MGAGELEKGFLSVSLMSLWLEDSWHAGQGCEATWQGRFLVAGQVFVKAAVRGVMFPSGSGMCQG